MRRTLAPIFSLALLTMLASAAALAALPNGAKAPDFTTQASLAGKPFTFSLADALKKGPVVLYFYPAAFTPGCTVEAHNFAEATDKFKTLGATVIGVSYDKIDTLNKFSVSECRNKFAVASDADQKIMKAYDAVLPPKPDWANRTSYVIAPDRRSALLVHRPEPRQARREHDGRRPEVGRRTQEESLTDTWRGRAGPASRCGKKAAGRFPSSLQVAQMPGAFVPARDRAPRV